MGTWPHLRQAPITEALIDIRVDLPAETDLGTLASFQDAIKERYPQKRERRAWHGRIELKRSQDPLVHQSSGGVDGFLFTSPDGTQVVQARMDGFTFSRLKAYETWENLRDEAKTLWNRYRDITHPTRITRVAVRYINRLVLPLPVQDFKQWVLTTPDIAPTLPQALATFFLRLVIPFPEANCKAIVTQTIEPGDHHDTVPLIFDIDVFAEEERSCEADDLWSRFEALREIKNRIFWESITRQTEEKYR